MTIGNLSMRLQQLGPALHRRRDAGRAHLVIHRQISQRVSTATAEPSGNPQEVRHG